VVSASKVKSAAPTGTKTKAQPVLPKVKAFTQTISPATQVGDIVKFEKKTKPVKTGQMRSSMNINVSPYSERKGEDYMSPSQQDHFRKILMQWKQQLLQDMDRTMHHLQDEAANFPDPNDRASQEEEFSLELRARDRERKLIKKIEEALHKIDEGEYGYCDACGVEIGIRRLEARPTANLCIDCKTLDEIREKQMGG